MHLFNILFFRFVRAFRERVSPEQRPIVVHCSAGVGRSGTMIAIDRILQGIRKYDVVDIFGIVYEMRKERVWMVQTEQQYICIHQVRFQYWISKHNCISPDKQFLLTKTLKGSLTVSTWVQLSVLFHSELHYYFDSKHCRQAQ